MKLFRRLKTLGGNIASLWRYDLDAELGALATDVQNAVNATLPENRPQKAGKMSDWYQASNAEHNRIVGFVSSDPKPAVLHILQSDPRKLFSKHRKHFTTANAIFAVSHLNINTVEELIRFTPAQLFNIPRVGHLTLAYIREVLNKHGLSLADGVTLTDNSSRDTANSTPLSL